MAKPKPIPHADLIVALAVEHECSLPEARRILGSVQSVVARLVADGKTVRLPALATFSAVDVPERQVRNPATGEMQTAAATRQVRIAATRPFKTAVKEGTS